MMRRASTAIQVAILALAGCKGNLVVDEIDVSIEPASAAQGETVTVFVTGVGTGFHPDRPDTTEWDADPRLSVPGDDGGVTFGHVKVDNAHRARVEMTVTPEAAPGQRTIRVETGDLSTDLGLTITESSPLPRIDLDPSSGIAGTVEPWRVDVCSDDGSMSFDQDSTVVTFAEESGMHLVSTEHWFSTCFRMYVDIDPDAPEGSWPVAVTSGTDLATAPFVVHRAAGTRLYVHPAEAERGTVVDLGLRVEGTTLSAADLDLYFPASPGIVVDSIRWVDSASASATVTVPPDAVIGSFEIRLSSGGREAASLFTVKAASGSEPFLRLYPSAVEQGTPAADIALAGVYTHFSPSSSDVSLDVGAGVDVTGFWVLDAEHAVARVSVDATAPAGASVLQVETGAEIASGVLKVIVPESMHVRADPAEIEQGTAGAEIAIEVDGARIAHPATLDAWFEEGSGTVVRAIGDVTESGARLAVDASPTAPTGVTLLHVEVGDESAFVPFTVLPSGATPSFTIDPPFLQVPSSGVGVRLHGVGTGWDASQDYLAFSSPGMEVEAFEVDGPETARAIVSVPAWTTERRTIAAVISDGGIVAASWTLLPPATRSVSLHPSTVVQGMEGTVLTAVGDGTGFVAGLTTGHAPPGSGVRIDMVEVFDGGLARITLDASTESPPGDYGLSLVTGGEKALATFTVTGAASSAVALASPRAVPAGGTSAIAIAGSATGFEAGVTTVDVSIPSFGTVVEAGPPAVADPTSLVVDVTSDPALAGFSLPLSVATDLATVRAWISFVASEGDAWPSVVETCLDASSVRTISVSAMGLDPPDMVADPPSAEALTPGVTVTGVLAVDPGTATMDLAVGGPGEVDGGAVVIRLHGATYDWSLAFPVKGPGPSASAVAGMPFAGGVLDGVIGVRSTGFDLSDASLTAASPGRVIFTGEAMSTGDDSADVRFDAAVVESSTPATIFLLPAPEPWSIPVQVDVNGADPRIFGVPSAVWETVPAGGPDLLAFTSVSGIRLGLWTIASSGSPGPAFDLLAADGISVLGSVPAGRIAAMAETGPARFYVRVGGPADAGLGYWLSARALLEGVSLGEIEPNDDVSTAEGLSAPGTAGALKAAVGWPLDVDVFGIPATTPACYEALATRPVLHALSGPFLRLALLDVSGAETYAVSGGTGATGSDPVLCTDGSEGEAFLAVTALAGTTGDYSLVPRWPVVISELDDDLATGRFVEIAGNPATSLAGYVLEVVDASSGDVLGSVDLAAAGALPEDGLLVIASPGTIATAEIEDPAMDLLSAPFAVRVCSPVHGTCDAVQVGGVPGAGEGASVLDPAELPAGRLWGIDTDGNEWDFYAMAAPSPGEPNGVPGP